MTKRMVTYVINKLRCEASFTSIAKEVNLSLPTVIRIFDLVSYSLKELLTAISIDEFKGNTGKKVSMYFDRPREQGGFGYSA